MPFIYFLCSQITFKRFVLFWVLFGMLFTHSWLTEPTTPKFYQSFAIRANLLCGFICLAGLVFSVLFNKNINTLKLSLYPLAMVLYFSLAIVSNLITRTPVNQFALLQLAIPIFFGLSITYLFSEKEIKNLLVAITIFGLCNACFSLVIIYLSNGSLPFAPSGFISDRNGLARYLALVNVFILIEFLLEKSKPKKMFLSVVLALILISISTISSRSGYIVYLISSSIVLFLFGSKKITRIAIFALPALLILFSIFTYIRIHSEKMNVVNYSDLGRIYVAKAGINMIKAHPLKGVGYRMSPDLVPYYADRNLPGIQMPYIHNWFIVLWAEWGLSGFLLFCWMNGSLIVANYKKFKSLGIKDGKYALFSFTSLIILMIDALVLPNYDYESIYWIVLAIAIISVTKNQIPSPVLKENMLR